MLLFLVDVSGLSFFVKQIFVDEQLNYLTSQDGRNAGALVPAGGRRVALLAPAGRGGGGRGVHLPAPQNHHTGVGGILRANSINGPIQIHVDPQNPNLNYVAGSGHNARTLREIAAALDRQATLGLSSLTRMVFTPQQQAFILRFLLINHPNVYNNLMVHDGNPYMAAWWKQGNTIAFRNLLSNGQ